MRRAFLVVAVAGLLLWACGGDDAATGAKPAEGAAGMSETAADPGDGTCACEATGPACAAWFESHCSGTPTCPATPADLRKASHWGARTSSHLATDYSECSDGSTWFFDQGFEYAMTLEFDAAGALTYEANEAGGGAFCGVALGGATASGVTCRTCDVLGAAGDTPACAVDASGDISLPPM